MESYEELVDLVRRALVAKRTLRAQAVHRLERHRMCTPALLTFVDVGNYVAVLEFLEHRRPADVSPSVLQPIEDARAAIRGDGGTPFARSSGPAAWTRHAFPVPSVSRPSPSAPATRVSIARTSGKSVVMVGASAEAVVPTIHAPDRDVQRWVRRPERSDSWRPLPDLKHGTAETERWRDEIRHGAWICPWPDCPRPKLHLKVGPIRVPHVAHDSIAGHGRDADWVLATIAELQRLTAASAVVVSGEPPTVLLNDIPFVIVSARWSAGITPIIQRATAMLTRPPFVVVRAARLPRRVVPIQVFEERRSRWGLRASTELLDGLRDTARVIAAPEVFDELHPLSERGDVPVWGARWVGLGLESHTGHLQWRPHHERSPVVAIELENDRAAKVLRRLMRDALDE